MGTNEIEQSCGFFEHAIYSSFSVLSKAAASPSSSTANQPAVFSDSSR